MSTATRLNFRVQPEIEQRLRAAADVAHLSLTDFVIKAASAEADEVLMTHTLVPSDYFDTLLAALEAPYRPNGALRAAAQHARSVVKHAKATPEQQARPGRWIGMNR